MITVDTTSYVWSHGREPRGSGLWYFAFDGDERDLLSAYGTYSKCIGDARKLAVAKGYTRITVMP